MICLDLTELLHTIGVQEGGQEKKFLRQNLKTTKERADYMAEFVNQNIVTVSSNQGVPLTTTAVSGKQCIVHRDGSSQVTLRGITNQCKARYKVSFGANVALPAGATVSNISAALAINGEPLNSATAIVTPTAAGDYANIFIATFIEIPRGCCLTVAAENTSTQDVLFANSNMIVERVC